MTKKKSNTVETAIQKFIAKGENRKVFVLDTNILMTDPDAMYKFEDNVVVIPDMVIEEMDNHKKDAGDTGYNVRKAHRNLKDLREVGNLIQGVELPDGGLIIVMTSLVEDAKLMPLIWSATKPDNVILAMTKRLQETFPNVKVAIVSNDTNVQIKADEIGIQAEDYLHERVEEDYLSYTGRLEIPVTSDEFDLFRASQHGDVTDAKLDEDFWAAVMARNGIIVKENAFVMLRNITTNGTLVGKVRNGQVVPLQWTDDMPYDITPRNIGQRFAVEALMASSHEIPLVILTGSAGTAKTFLTLACGLQQTMITKDYRRIVLTRANVEFDKDIGALPGTEEEKVGPLMRGAMDNLELLVDEKGVRKKGTASEMEISDKVMELFDRGYIKTEALGFLRGRSVTRQYVFIDEAQNTSVSQMKGILTRAGDSTKIIISGDLEQIDNPRLDRHNNGLAYALKLMAGDPLCAVVGFSDKESTRSALAARVAAKIKE